MKILFVFLFCLLFSFLTFASDKRSENTDIICLLNSQSSNSDLAIEKAAKSISEKAKEGKLLHKYILAVFSSPDHRIPALRLSKELREEYINETKPKIEKLAKTKNNALAWYLLSIESNDLTALKRAAQAKNTQALNTYGTLLLTKSYNADEDDKRREKGMELAFAMFSTAAAEKDANALFNLGYCYLNGLGTNQNLELAITSFKLAAEKDHPQAINNLGGILRDGLLSGTPDLIGAAKYFEKSAALGNSYGELNFALALLNGNGVKCDKERAVKLLNSSMERGCEEAILALAMCYYNGNGVERDRKKAFSLFLKSADKGNAIAMENLAICYDRGEGGVKPNANASLLWKMRARAARGDKNARVWLENNKETNENKQ